MKFLRSRIFRAIASIGLAALLYFLTPPCFNSMYMLGVLLLLVVFINFSTFFGRFRWLTHITRIAVGGLFIFSGFIKANDPVGFSYKLQEYFQVFGQGFSCDMQVAANTSGIPCEAEFQKREIDKKYQGIIQRADEKFYDSSWAEAKKIYEEALTVKPNDVYAKDQVTKANEQLGIPKPPAPEETFMQKVWKFFEEHALFLAIFICGFEIAVGLFLLLGIQVRWTLFLLLAMIVFFSFLTFYSACCNKVNSCGCFGDAINLTPWESFWKDLILLILITVLFVGEHNIQPLFKNRILLAGVAGVGLFLSFAFPVYTWRHLPVIDFRPYKVGTNWYEASHMKDPAKTGCVTDSTVNVYFYKHTQNGKMMHFISMDSFPDSLWTYYCREDLKIRKGNCLPTILDFTINYSEEFTDSLLQRKGPQFLLVMYDIDKADRSKMGAINEFYASCEKNGVPFHALSGAGEDRIAAFRKETGAKFPILYVDPTALKTIIRSNPGLVQLTGGVATSMWHVNDFPSYNDAMKH